MKTIKSPMLISEDRAILRTDAWNRFGSRLTTIRLKDDDIGSLGTASSVMA
jgi:hypothetical protein